MSISRATQLKYHQLWLASINKTNCPKCVICFSGVNKEQRTAAPDSPTDTESDENAGYQAVHAHRHAPYDEVTTSHTTADHHARYGVTSAHRNFTCISIHVTNWEGWWPSG